MSTTHFIHFYNSKACRYNNLTGFSIDQIKGYLKGSLIISFCIYILFYSLLSFALPSRKSNYKIDSPFLNDKTWSQIHWKQSNNKSSQAWLPSRMLFDEWYFARYAIASQMTIAFYTDSSPALNHIINKNQKLKINKVTPTYIQVQFQGQKLWVLRHQLTIDTEDIGYLVSKHKTPLREVPLHKSKVIGYLKPGLRLTPANFQKDFALIHWKNKPYFVPLSYMLSRLDFIKRAKIDQQWVDVLFVIGHFIKTINNQFVPVSQIKGMQGRELLAYTMALKTSIHSSPDVKGQIIQTLSPFTPLLLIAKDHLQLHTKPQTVMTTHQLFDRKLFDVASTKGLMLASAKGIFKSYNGNLWQRLAFFEDKDFPLAISPEGKIYIGPYRSTDLGKTFQQYIRWDFVFDVLKSNGIHAVSELRIKDIEFLNHNAKKLRLTLNIGRDGSQKMKLAKIISYDEGMTWQSEIN